jgi:hypothetical protein
VKPKYVWGVLAFFALFWGWIYFQFQDMAFDLPVLATTLILVLMILKIWTASEVSSRMIEDRRSGALELLLSTPLSVKQIAAGQTLALRRLFLKPVVVLLVIEAIILTGRVHRWQGDSSRTLVRLVFGAGMITLLLDLWAIKWFCMWRSLFSKSIERVLIRAICLILILPWAAFFATTALASLFFAATGVSINFGEEHATIMWLIFSVAISLFLGVPARANFLRFFREIATQQFEARPQIPNSFGLWWRALWSRFRSQRPELKEHRSFVKRHPVVVGTAALIAIVLELCWIRQVYWRTAVSDRITALRQAGFPTNEREMARLQLPIPAAENAAMLFKEAMPVVPPPRVRQDPTNGMRQELQLNQRQLKLLHKLTGYERCSFEVAGANSYWQPQLIYSLENHARLLQIEGIVAIQDRDKEQLEQSLRSLLAIARVIKNEPRRRGRHVEESALRKMEILFENAYRVDLLHGVDWKRWSDAIGQLSASEALAASLVIQRAQELELAQNAELGLMMRGFGGSSGERTFYAAIYGLSIRTGSRDKNLAQHLDYMAEAIEAAKKPFEARWKDGKKLDQESSWGSLPFWSSGFRNNLSWTFSADLRIEVKIRCLRTALEILDDQGGLAVQLLILTPWHSGDAVGLGHLCDPYSNELLHCQKLEHGFKVYSIGPNEIDDGGEFSKNPPLDLGVTFDKNAKEILY